MVVTKSNWYTNGRERKVSYCNVEIGTMYINILLYLVQLLIIYYVVTNIVATK